VAATSTWLWSLPARPTGACPDPDPDGAASTADIAFDELAIASDESGEAYQLSHSIILFIFVLCIVQFCTSIWAAGQLSPVC